MPAWVWALIGLFIGGTIGLLSMGLLMATKRGDNEQRRLADQREEWLLEHLDHHSDHHQGEAETLVRIERTRAALAVAERRAQSGPALYDLMELREALDAPVGEVELQDMLTRVAGESGGG